MLKLLRNSELRTVFNRAAGIHSAAKSTFRVLNGKIDALNEREQVLSNTINRMAEQRDVVRDDMEGKIKESRSTATRLSKIEDIISRFTAELDTLS